jgi:hypothetical protein
MAGLSGGGIETFDFLKALRSSFWAMKPAIAFLNANRSYSKWLLPGFFNHHHRLNPTPKRGG